VTKCLNLNDCTDVDKVLYYVTFTKFCGVVYDLSGCHNSSSADDEICRRDLPANAVEHFGLGACSSIIKQANFSEIRARG
jgi:hypothetical protein